MNAFDYEYKVINNLIPHLELLNKKYSKIDWGGCGTFSYHLSEKLNDLNVKNEIVYIPEEHTPPNSYRCEVRFHHILVKVENLLIDNFGIKNINDFNKTLLPLKSEKLKDMLEDKKLWNNVFPHEDWNLLAEDIMNIKVLPYFF